MPLAHIWHRPTRLVTAVADSSGEAAVKEKIATLGDYAELAGRLHEVVTTSAPQLEPRLWYGMPGYARSAKSPVIVFFRVDDGVVSFGITEKANLHRPGPQSDQLVESAWFVAGLDDATEKRIASIVRQAAAEA